MPRPNSWRSISSLSESNDGSSILFSGIEEAYLSATTNTSIASRSQRHFSDDLTQQRRQSLHVGRRVISLPYVASQTANRRQSLDLSALKERNQINDCSKRGREAFRALFDPKQHGSVRPFDTFAALRKMGFSTASGIFFSGFCHLVLAYPLRITGSQEDFHPTKWIPDPLFRIRIDDVETISKKLSMGELRLLIDQYSFAVRCYSRLRHLHQVDTTDGFGIMVEMRHTSAYSAIFTFPFVWIVLRFILPRHMGKTSVEDILNALNGTYFYLLAIKAQQMNANIVLSTPKRAQHHYLVHPKTA